MPSFHLDVPSRDLQAVLKQQRERARTVLKELADRAPGLSMVDAVLPQGAGNIDTPDIA